MTTNEKYNTLKSFGESLYKEKGSKFIGKAVPCSDKEEAKEFINRFREENPNAVHVCFAWRFGIDQYEDRYL